MIFVGAHSVRPLNKHTKRNGFPVAIKPNTAQTGRSANNSEFLIPNSEFNIAVSQEIHLAALGIFLARKLLFL